MGRSKNYQILDGTTLKIIAMISMVFDHVGDLFFPEILWLRMVGRLAMPLFSFCIAEGYAHTRNKDRYLLRMGLFALVSEIPFDLAFEGKVGLGHQNIMLSFFLSILAMKIFDLVRGERKDSAAPGRTALGTLCVAAMAALAILLRADYTCFAVIAVFLFYIFREKYPFIRSGVGVAFLALTRTVGFYCATGFSLIPLLLYNGKRGRGLKWLFYAFYPGHLLLLFLLKTALGT